MHRPDAAEGGCNGRIFTEVENEFDERMKAIHIPLIQDYLQNHKTEREISNWYDDIKPILEEYGNKGSRFSSEESV